MTRFSITREFRVPKGAIKVADKLSDAVAYVGTTRNGKPNAMLFVGKQSKPLWFYQFPNEARRAAKVEEAFKDRRDYLERVKARRAEPSSTALRNRRLKEVMVEEFGEGKVTVHGSRGTAYGWVTLPDRRQAKRLEPSAGPTGSGMGADQPAQDQHRVLR